MSFSGKPTNVNDSPIWDGYKFISASPGKYFSKTFTYSDLVAGVLILNHGLVSQYPVINIYDGYGALVIPNSVVGTSSIISTIDLSGFGSIYGTWTAVVLAGGNMTGAYVKTFTNTDVIGNKLTVAHNLNNQYNTVQVYRNDGYAMFPDNIKAVNANSLEIHLQSATPITGTWIAVIGGAIGSSGGGNNLIGLYSTIPAAGTAGRRFTPTDGVCEFVDDSINWRPIISGKVMYKTPAASNFTKLGASTATLTDNVGTLVLFTPANQTTNELFYNNTALASTFTIDSCHETLWGGGAGGAESLGAITIGAGITDGLIYRFGLYYSASTITLQIQRFTSIGGGGADIPFTATIFSSLPAVQYIQSAKHYLRVVQDSTNITFYYSANNGTNYVQVYQQAKAAYLTAARVGLYSGNSSGQSYSTTHRWLSFNVS